MLYYGYQKNDGGKGPQMSELIKLSVSKTKTFEHCQAQYKFNYIEKLPKKSWQFHELGKFIHEVLENFHKEYINGSKEPFNIVMSRCFKAALKNFPKLDEAGKKESFEIIDAYLKKISTEAGREEVSRITAVEKNFLINISEDIKLTGMIDRVQKDKDGIWHLCDYKTIRHKKYLKNDWFQLLTYAYAMLMEDPDIEKVRGSYILLRHNFEYFTNEFSRDQILEVKKSYEDYASKIREEKLWRPLPSKLCGFCDWVDICPEGSAFIKPKVSYGKSSW